MSSPLDAPPVDPVGSTPSDRIHMLTGPDGTAYPSRAPGAFGGHRTGRIYGRLDCPSALRAIRRGGYVAERVFFADPDAAVSAGYRPCAVCLPDAYLDWRARLPWTPPL